MGAWIFYQLNFLTPYSLCSQGDNQKKVLRFRVPSKMCTKFTLLLLKPETSMLKLKND